MALVAFVAMMTPGPNNVLVTNAAATRGPLATAAAITSIVGGSMIMLAITQAGLAPYSHDHLLCILASSWRAPYG